MSPNQAIPTTTAREAPVLIPRMPGSASGLRVTPCITAPEIAERGTGEEGEQGAGDALGDRGRSEAVGRSAEGGEDVRDPHVRASR